MPLLSTKLRNQIHKIDPTITVSLKNISINGTKRGCSGFIQDPVTKRCVYLSTEEGGYLQKVMYREAAHMKDYRGGRNHFTGTELIAEEAVELLHGERS